MVEFKIKALLLVLLSVSLKLERNDQEITAQTQGSEIFQREAVCVFSFSVITLNLSCVGTNGLNCRAARSPGVCTEASKRGAFLASSAVSIQSPALLLNFYLYSSRERSLPEETRRASCRFLFNRAQVLRCVSKHGSADVPRK